MRTSYSAHCAMVVEEAPPSICTQRTIMIVIGIVLSFVGLAYLCWLLFALAVHALPFFAGVTVGLAAYHGGSGPVAAIIVGAIAGGIILALGQVSFYAHPSCAPRSRSSSPYRLPWPDIMPRAGSRSSSYPRRLGAR
jgi:hypothetical protein